MLSLALGTLGIGGLAAVIALVPGAQAIALKLVMSLLRIITGYPWQCALAAALALAWWQSHRASAWEHQAQIEAVAHQMTKANFHAAVAEWKRQAAAARAEQVRLIKQGKAIAHDAQELHDRMAADNAGLRDYIAAHRLRGQATLPLDAGAGDHGPALPADAAADPFVATRQSDLEICDDLYAYAFGSYVFTRDLRSLGQAMPAIQFGNDLTSKEKPHE